METTRVIKNLAKVSKEIELIIEDLSDDGFEEYADSLQNTLDKISLILFSLNND